MSECLINRLDIGGKDYEAYGAKRATSHGDFISCS